MPEQAAFARTASVDNATTCTRVDNRGRLTTTSTASFSLLVSIPLTGKMGSDMLTSMG